VPATDNHNDNLWSLLKRTNDNALEISQNDYYHSRFCQCYHNVADSTGFFFVLFLYFHSLSNSVHIFLFNLHTKKSTWLYLSMMMIHTIWLGFNPIDLINDNSAMWHIYYDESIGIGSIDKIQKRTPFDCDNSLFFDNRWINVFFSELSLLRTFFFCVWATTNVPSSLAPMIINVDSNLSPAL
jgi:hypothetical protein